MLEIYFSQFRYLLCQNRPEMKDRNSGQIWNPFPTWIEVSISYLDKKTQETIFFGISRASRPLLVSINRPISFKRNVLVLVLSFRHKILLIGLTSWRGEEHGRKSSQHHDERLNSYKGVDVAISK
jgi:hypothetical protein